jgi:hypothetical protein
MPPPADAEVSLAQLTLLLPLALEEELDEQPAAVNNAAAATPATANRYDDLIIPPESFPCPEVNHGGPKKDPGGSTEEVYRPTYPPAESAG